MVDRTVAVLITVRHQTAYTASLCEKWQKETTKGHSLDCTMTDRLLASKLLVTYTTVSLQAKPRRGIYGVTTLPVRLIPSTFCNEEIYNYL